MRKACTKEQHELFDKIFGRDNIPKEGTLVYVSNHKKEWIMRFYSEFKDGVHHCFQNQQKEGKNTPWRYISLTNPLIEQPQFI